MDSFGPFVEQDLLQQIEDGLLGFRNGQRIKDWPFWYMMRQIRDLPHAA